MGLFSKIKNSFVKSQDAAKQETAKAAPVSDTKKVSAKSEVKAPKSASKVTKSANKEVAQEKTSGVTWHPSHPEALSVLIQPDVTEKATNRIADNQYVFIVQRRATKPAIAKAVETLYKVDVTGVRVLNRRGKILRSGRTVGQRKAIKKAFVSVKKGQTIALFDQGEVR